jgi:hypothetical protein
MAEPILALAQGGGAGVFRYGSTREDGGASYEMLALSQPVAPAGEAQEAVFCALTLVVTHTAAAVLRVTPVVDGQPHDGTGGTSDERFTINLEAASTRTTELPFEMGLSVPLMLGGVEVGRLGMIGTWFQVKVETVGGVGASGTDLIVDLVALEWEPVQNQRNVMT